MRTTHEAKPNRIGIRISDDAKERLVVLADRKNMSVSEYIREMIEGKGVEHDNNCVEHERSFDFSLDVENELKDTLRMVELSSSKEEVPLFLKNLHDRLESGELQIVNGKLKLGYSEIFEVLNRAETKKWLKGVWDACDLRGRTYQEGLRAVFEEGSKKAIEAIYGDQR